MLLFPDAILCDCIPADSPFSCIACSVRPQVGAPAVPTFATTGWLACSALFVASAVGTSMELGFTSGDEPAEPDDKPVVPNPRKQSWIAALGVLFTFSAASALVQLLIGLAEAKLNVLQFGSKLTPSFFPPAIGISSKPLFVCLSALELLVAQVEHLAPFYCCS